MTSICQQAFFIILFLFQWRGSAPTRPYKHIGCYRDDRSRAVPYFLGYLDTNYDIDECALKASKSSMAFTVFALQVGHECRGGFGKTYDKYGTSNNCNYGGGGGWANDVYRFADEDEILWPSGTFSLLKPSSGCPSGMVDDGWYLQDTVDGRANTHSPVLSIDGHVTKGYVVRSFCTKTQGTSPDWPQGKYCVYKGDNSNTPTLTSGRLRIDTSTSNNKGSEKLKNSQAVTKYNAYSYAYINVFCQTNGDRKVPIDLPTSQPFYLLPYGSPECQQVKWMIAKKEWIGYATRNYKSQQSILGKVPYFEVGNATHKGTKMFYCLYTSCNYTLIAKQGSFQSPRYPENYPDGQLCSWTIGVPANHSLTVRFTRFSLSKSKDEFNDTDVLQLYKLENTTFVLAKTFQGDRKPFKVTSTSNLSFVFHSNGVNSSYGFHAEYKVFESPEPIDTTGRPTILLTTTPKYATTSYPTTEWKQTNKTKQESLTDDTQETGTVLLIVIPLVSLILIVVVSVDIFCRWRLHQRSKNLTDNKRGDFQENGKTAENPMYSCSPDVIAMKDYSKTNMAATSDSENHDTGYGRLSHIAPRRDVPEDYQELNRTSCGSRTTNIMSLPDKGPEVFYHELDGPGKDELVDDESTYQSIDKDSCDYQSIDKQPRSNALSEINVLYDRVA